MEPVSAEIRAEVIAARQSKTETRVIAIRYGVSESWVRRVVQRHRESGEMAPRVRASRKAKWLAWQDWLTAKIQARPDIYLRELQAELNAERGIEVCLMTICKACRALGFTRKKRR